VRGYEYAKEQYVIVEPEDFEKLPVPSLHTVELTAFVSADEIDPIYYEKTYYLEPDESGVKPFALLVRALEEKGLLAVGKLAIRQKEHLCALRPYEGAMALQTLYFPDEIRDAGETDLSEVEVSEPELEMAYALIDMLEKPFEPGEYRDEYREQLMAMIQAKLEGGEVVAAEEAAPAPAPVDLMAALRASVEATKQRQAGDGDAAADEKPSGRKKSAAKSKTKRKQAKAAS
jgi:DNA end-binding protein Ku